MAPPALVWDGGRAADESVYLLAEMIGFARRFGANAVTLSMAWRQLTKPVQSTLPAEIASEGA